MAEKSPTPMMAQWHACKKKAKDALLLFRLGDFYEAFYEDANVISKALELTLTQRQNIPMCGVPFHTCENYTDKLVAKGFKVAIAEQVEDPKETKGLVMRKIVRFVTPGTLIQSNLLVEKSNNFLLSLAQVGYQFGLCVIDLTTSQCKVIELDKIEEVKNEIYRLKPSEILISKKFFSENESFLKKLVGCHITKKEPWFFDHEIAYEKLLNHFGFHNLDGFGLKGMTAGINAAGALFTYLQDELEFSLQHITSIQVDHLANYMAIDRSTMRHLELIEPSFFSLDKTTLLDLLDKTATAMGGRLLKHWIQHPLLDCVKISERQLAIEEFTDNFEILSRLYSHLKKISDLDRIMMRTQNGYASPRDLANIALSLKQTPFIHEILQSFSCPFLTRLAKDLHDLTSLTKIIDLALNLPAPLRLGDGAVFKLGYHKDLDEIKLLSSNNKQWLQKYQDDLKTSYGIKNLKVGYSKAFGYYIDISKAQAKHAPDFFHKRQTLVNSERFTTQKLQEYEGKILSAEEKIRALEIKLFEDLRKKVCGYTKQIDQISKSIASIDTLLSLAKVALKYDYVKPVVDNSFDIEIYEGRHPILEKAASSHFIPNDTVLNSDEHLFIITGPNMGGKSTYLRQTALIIIMAQIGSFVPATKAKIGMIDKVFSRIGANDDLARGQSTFMVEMSETANIINHATEKSFVILDEIGRGTSTYDGISIAWAVAEHLLIKKTKTLFATHYSELTEMEGKIQGAVNFQVTIQETGKNIVFLHKITKGAADKSYGIHVAKLAGLPSSLITKAENRLLLLEKPKQEKKKRKKKYIQPELLSEKPNPVIEELRSMDCNHLSPMEALQKLSQLQKQIKDAF